MSFFSFIEEINPLFQTKLLPCIEGIASSTASLEETINKGSINYHILFEDSIMIKM
jgi:hypothetical protein